MAPPTPKKVTVVDTRSSTLCTRSEHEIGVTTTENESSVKSRSSPAGVKQTRSRDRHRRVLNSTKSGPSCRHPYILHHRGDDLRRPNVRYRTWTGVTVVSRCHIEVHPLQPAPGSYTSTFVTTRSPVSRQTTLDPKVLPWNEIDAFWNLCRTHPVSYSRERPRHGNEWEVRGPSKDTIEVSDTSNSPREHRP